jgi:putative flippase GtrA
MFRSSAMDGGIVAATLPRYASVVLLNYLITLAVVKVVMSAGFRIQIGMIAAVLLTTATSYVLSKVWPPLVRDVK